MLYDISINPPIISVLAIIFMICMEMLLAIYGDSDFEKLQKAEDIKKALKAFTDKTVDVNIAEIKQSELDATLVAENVASQLERRIGFRRAMKQSIGRTMRMGAQGIKIMCSGRLGGAEIARSESVRDGSIPLHTIRADIDYGTAEAHTTYGCIGIKCWIYKGEILPEAKKAPQNKREGSAK